MVIIIVIIAHYYISFFSLVFLSQTIENNYDILSAISTKHTDASAFQKSLLLLPLQFQITLLISCVSEPETPTSKTPSCPMGKAQSACSPPTCFSPSLDYTSSLPANCRPLSETFLLILISFTITIFHVCGVLCLAGKGKDNYCGVSGINPTRCHLMACLPQWLMNRLLVSNHLHPLLFHMARSVPGNQFAQLWQVRAT